MLKTVGYSISSLSVFCLGAASWNGAHGKPEIMALLAIGMATSILGMAFRWVSFLREQQAKGKPAFALEGRPQPKATRAMAARGEPQMRISK
jgi:hypothetical protein